MYCHVKIMQSSYKHLKYFPDIYNLSTQKQAPFTVTPPRHDEAQDWRGDIHIRDTSPDRDVSYLEFVFSIYV